MAGGAAPRTLLVGPLGPRPWITQDELVEDLEHLGHDVLVNGFDADALVPPLEAVPNVIGRARNSLPSMASWMVRMVIRWRRTARRNLAGAAIDNIVVWDPILAGLCRLARPKGAVVTWVVSSPEGPRLYQRVLRAGLRVTADRLVSSEPSVRRRWAKRTVVVPLPLPERSSAPQIDAWVVFGSRTAPSRQTYDELRALARVKPAAAIVLDLREPDRLAAKLLDELVAVTGAARVWWSASDEWIARLGGSPLRAYDPNDALTVDHRHLRVLADGGSLFAISRRQLGVCSELLVAGRQQGPWTELVPAASAGVASTDRTWAAGVFSSSVV